MNTLYDWLAILTFAALAVLFLQRSVSRREHDKMWLYLPPSVACAFANFVGNQGYGWLAGIILALVIGYIFHILKPFARQP